MFIKVARLGHVEQGQLQKPNVQSVFYFLSLSFKCVSMFIKHFANRKINTYKLLLFCLWYLENPSISSSLHFIPFFILHLLKLFLVETGLGLCTYRMLSDWTYRYLQNHSGLPVTLMHNLTGICGVRRQSQHSGSSVWPLRRCCDVGSSLTGKWPFRLHRSHQGWAQAVAVSNVGSWK